MNTVMGAASDKGGKVSRMTVVTANITVMRTVMNTVMGAISDRGGKVSRMTVVTANITVMSTVMNMYHSLMNPFIDFEGPLSQSSVSASITEIITE